MQTRTACAALDYNYNVDRVQVHSAKHYFNLN